jgi:hypothetical protein
MINTYKSLSTILFLALISFYASAQNVGIGTISPNAKSALEIKPVGKQGLLIPRLLAADTANFGVLAGTEDGLTFYATDTKKFYYYNSTVGKWYSFGSSVGGSYTASNGLTLSSSNLRLGGTLSGNTSIAMAGNNMIFTGVGKLGIGLSPNYKVDILETTSSIYALNSENTYSGSFDSRAVRGYAVNNPGWGYGGEFTGGYKGIAATAQGGTYASFTYGVFGESYGTAGTRIGVYGYASGGATNYGIYGEYGGTGYAGYFVGNVFSSGGSYLGSDEKLKENIKPYTGAIDMLRKMNVKTYKYRSDGIYKGMNFNKDIQYGFIAQEVEAVFPEFVKETSHVVHDKDKGKDGLSANPEIITFKSLNYNALIPILTQAIKEQQALIDLQNEKINELNKRLEALERGNK